MPDRSATLKDCANPSGLCMCGCGKPTAISNYTNARFGLVRGQPYKYLLGHARPATQHRLSEIDESLRRATCSVCGPVPISRRRPGGTCAWRCDGSAASRNRRRRRLGYLYGLTLEQYEALLESQEGVCAMPGCDREHTLERPLHVDHNHLTGAVVALLCNMCNSGLGMFRNNPALLRAAAIYAARHHEVTG